MSGMTPRVVPMLQVPDVRATVAWYESIGFRCERVNEPCGEMDWALMTFGSTEVMFNAGGHASTAHRRDVDLYVYTPDIDALHERLESRVEIVEAPHETFYGMYELIIRDLNRFWVTFGWPKS